MKVHFCHFNEGNLPVIHVKDLKITTGPCLRDFSRRKVPLSEG